jgi:hypothetical protein
VPAQDWESIDRCRVRIQIENTPNPRALKFTVGEPVGGPATLKDPESDPRFGPILSVAGVQSVFITADFVTVTKTEDGDWEAIAPAVVSIIEGAFS